MTIVTKKLTNETYCFSQPVSVLKVDDDNRIIDMADGTPDQGGEIVSTNITVMSRLDLQSVVEEAIARGMKSFHKDVIAKNLKKKLIRAYRFDGWYSPITSLEEYFDSSMRLLQADVRRDLFGNVHVGKGTVVKNCILLQDTYVGSNVQLNCVITDKNAVIKDGRNLSGHQTKPFYIGKGEMV